MDFNSLLSDFQCECGRKHTCNIEAVLVFSGALNKINTVVTDYSHILLVADNNTYAVCGEKVKAQLGDKLESEAILIRDGVLIPDEIAIAEVRAKVNCETDLIVGIGSGVIQDICKYVSFNEGLPYHIIATAPSMDGYASAGAAMITDNMKITYNAHVPQVIIGDVDVLQNAPMEMIQAGYGDILGKFSCLNDWKLSSLVNDEYFCPRVYDLTYDMLNKTKDLGEELLKRSSNAVKILMESLVGVGIAMAYVGNSRPASGSEHHLSHFFEVVGILNNEPYFKHGIDVAYSAVYTQKLREDLLENVSWENRSSENFFNRESYEKDIKKIYTKAASGIIDLQNRVGLYNQNRLPLYKEKWEDIKKILRNAPASDELVTYLLSVGLEISDFDSLYGKEKINNAIKYGKDLKDRYTVLWMYYDIFN